MLLTTKINKADKELRSHKCNLPKDCACTALKQQVSRWLEQVYVEFGLDPKLIGGNMGSPEPF